MLPLIGILGGSVGSAVGGAVAKAINGRKNRGLTQQLKTTAAQLESTIKTLEVERRRVEELQDDSALTEKLEEERVRVATLQCQAAALQQEKLELERRLLTTKLETEAQLAAYQTQLEQLKYKVTAVINKLLSKAIDESEATKELEELGCHVDYVETEELLKDAGGQQRGEWSVEQGCSLLLDDRDKVRRLISHGMPTSRAAHDLATSPLLGSGAQADSVASTRFPVVTFPQLKAPASRGIVIPPLRLQDLQQQQQQQGHTTSAAQRRIHHTARTDTSDARDQLSLSLGYSPDLAKAARREPSADDQAARLEELSRLPSIKFVYSAQGQQNKAWVAKLPVEGSAAAPAYTTSTSPVPTYRADRDDTLLTSNDVSLVARW